MSRNRVFLVVSTGQNVANLPPVLEHASPGDHVQWIESDEARQGRWSEGARQVFKDSGLHLSPTIYVTSVNDPAQLAHACRAVVDNWSPRRPEVYLVANGGNKLAPLGLWLAWRQFDPVILYGDDRPAVCHSYRCAGPQRDSWQAHVRPYTRHGLDLEEILTATGHRIHDRKRATRFWPGELPRDIADEPYGVDPKEVARLHAAHNRVRLQAHLDSGEVVPYDKLATVVSQRQLDRWKRSLEQMQFTSAPFGDGFYKSLYHATANLIVEACQQAAKPAPVQHRPLGPAFERAVVRRVHAYLQTQRPACVQSAWHRVSIFHVSDSTRAVAELDVVLVLKNGILLHLECKAAQEVEKKDLDARFFNLQSAGSRLAQMALCIPLFTQFIQEQWAVDYHKILLRVENLSRIPLVLMTLPGQPTEYDVPDDSGAVQRYSCPTLEQGLDALLQPYEPGRAAACPPQELIADPLQAGA